MEYSPFIDKKGNKIGLEKLRFANILSIEENGIEEGYKVEFKSKWDDNFKKKHLCQTIASFANAEGGWLIVGLEDNTGKYIGIDKQRTDFSQTISQKLMEVTPRPKFDCRFLHETSDKKRGVLVIQIYGGVNPPYVCNGTIYTRSGSSKIPIKSDRGSIDELLNKRNRYDNLLKKFCINKFVEEKNIFLYCTIYLYNPYAEKKYESYFEDISELKERLSGEGLKSRVIESIDSVIRIGSDVISANSCTCMEQYFIDGNIKIYAPMFKLENNGIIADWIDTVTMYNKNVNLENMIIIDGMISYLTMFGLLQSVFNFMKESGYKVQDYQIVCEYKNIKNVVFYYRRNIKDQEQENGFISDIQDGKFYVSYLTDIKTEPVSYKGNAKKNDGGDFAWNLLEMFYLKLFGIDSDDFTCILKNSQERYNEAVFSAESYLL